MQKLTFEELNLVVGGSGTSAPAPTCGPNFGGGTRCSCPVGYDTTSSTNEKGEVEVKCVEKK